VLLGDAVAFLFILGLTHAIPPAARARELTRDVSGSLRRQAAGIWGLAAFLSGDPAGLVACAAASELITESTGSPELRWGFGPLGGLAIAALFAERFADAEQSLAIVLATADRIGAMEATATHVVIKAVLAIRQGRLADACGPRDDPLAWVIHDTLIELTPYPGNGNDTEWYGQINLGAVPPGDQRLVIEEFEPHQRSASTEEKDLGWRLIHTDILRLNRTPPTTPQPRHFCAPRWRPCPRRRPTGPRSGCRNVLKAPDRHNPPPVGARM
jgi:hypothetical protein